MSKHNHEHENVKEKETAKFQENNETAAASGESAEKSGPSGKNVEKEAEASAPEDGKAAGPDEKIAALEARLAEANDQYLRKAADFENYRKRMIREKQDAIDYANQSLLLDLIQTMDDFDRALKAAESCFSGGTGDKAEGQAAVFKTFYEGISMIEKRLSTQLENKWGLKRFDSLGRPFDPNFHEALMMDKSPDAGEPVVQEEFYKGYTLKDRVVRSAKVKVLMPTGGDGKSAESGAPKN